MRERVRAVLLLCAAVACLRGAPVSANGIVPEEIPGEPELMYVGTVKGIDGRYLAGATIQIRSKTPPFKLDTATDVIGHYKTADIGAWAKDSGKELDAAGIDITCVMEGYAVDRKFLRAGLFNIKGAVEVNFVMRPVKKNEDERVRREDWRN